MILKKKKSGFTLIELLVVIAIIGILSSVVLSSLNAARSKAADAAIKATMGNMRSQAALFYDDNSGSYANMCDSATVGGVYNILLNAAQRLGVLNIPTTVLTVPYEYSADGAVNSSVCHEDGTAWAAITSLKNPILSVTGGWCVDSAGASKESDSLAANVVVCP